MSIGEAILESAIDRPLKAVIIGLFIVLTALLGFMHQLEVGGEMSIAFVKIFKKHVRSMRAIKGRLGAQFSTWDDPEEEPKHDTVVQMRQKEEHDGGDNDDAPRASSGSG